MKTPNKLDLSINLQQTLQKELQAMRKTWAEFIVQPVRQM